MDKNIGFKIRKVRELKDFTQAGLADKLSMSQSAYSDMENGKQSVSKDFLKQIADALNVSTEVIENFSDQVFLNSGSKSGQYNKYNIKNPVKKIDELYNALLAEKDKQIVALEEVIKAKDELIVELRMK